MKGKTQAITIITATLIAQEKKKVMGGSGTLRQTIIFRGNLIKNKAICY